MAKQFHRKSYKNKLVVAEKDSFGNFRADLVRINPPFKPFSMKAGVKMKPPPQWTDQDDYFPMWTPAFWMNSLEYKNSAIVAYAVSLKGWWNYSKMHKAQKKNSKGEFPQGQYVNTFEHFMDVFMGALINAKSKANPFGQEFWDIVTTIGLPWDLSIIPPIGSPEKNAGSDETK